MEVYGQIKELAAAVLERDEAPKPLVELCWRLVGSRLTTKEVPDAEACREAAIAQLSSKRGDHRVALYVSCLNF